MTQTRRAYISVTEDELRREIVWCSKICPSSDWASKSADTILHRESPYLKNRTNAPGDFKN
jgi:hypothetical protein